MAASEPYYRHTLIDSARGEIRVLVIPPAPADQLSPVTCRIEVRSLASNPEYDAISYTRITSTDDNNGNTSAGDEPEDQKTTIVVDGAPFRVPTNAANSLQHLARKSTSSRSIRVWIDCVCISQDDPSEKARQILLMGRIYRQSRRVCVWLASTTPCEEDLGTLHPWWTRLWVVQEAALAKRLVFMCRDGVERTWRTVEKEMMREMRTTDSGGGRRDCNFDTIRRAREGYERHGNWDPSVHALLYAVRGLGCAKPDDRLYAVLGLVSKIFDLGVVPAYDAPVARPRLYADLVLETIKKTGNLEVLNCVREWRRGDGVDGTVLGLPSWAPNWSACDSRDPEPLVDLSKPRRTPGRYSAARLLDAKLGKNPEGSTLVLGGIRFDEVMQLGEPWYSDGSPIWRRDYGVLAGWADIAFSPRPLCPYTDGDDPNTPSKAPKEALFRTYIADYTSEGGSAPREHLETYVEAWCDRARWTPSNNDDTLEAYLQHNLTKQPRSTIPPPTAANSKQKGQSFIRAALDTLHPAHRHRVKGYLTYVERIERACSNRRLLVTKRGYIGLAPWNAQVGDVVAVLHGGDTPFLLRPAGAEPGVYSFVGEVFVYGTMGGEALAWENAAAAAREFRIV